MIDQVLWHGTQQEAFELLQALNRNCSCTVSSLGVRTTTCAPHLLLTDQRALNGLLFVRRILGQLVAQEFEPVDAEEPSFLFPDSAMALPAPSQ